MTRSAPDGELKNGVPGDEDATNGTHQAMQASADSRLTAPYFTPGSSVWLDALPQTPHVDLFRGCSFAALGPPATWGPSLRLYASMLFADSRGAVIFWGPEHETFYNEPYTPHIGKVHPNLMGKPFQVGFKEAFNDISKIFNQVFETKSVVEVHNMYFSLQRYGFVEETYFNAQFLPLRGDSGEIEGIYNTAIEVTAAVVDKRRQAIITLISTIPSFSVDETFSSVAKCLETNQLDVPLAMIFSFDESIADQDNLRLRMCTSSVSADKCAPKSSRLDASTVGIVPFLRKAQAKGGPLVLTDQETNFVSLFDGINWCGYEEPSRTVVIIPIKNSTGLLGFYVQGTNPRRGYEEASNEHAIEISKQIEAKWDASISVEEAKARELTLERRAHESEHTLREMAQYAPLGMFQVSADYEIKYANEQFWEITGHDRTNPSVKDFILIYAPEEQEDARLDYEQLRKGVPLIMRERRLIRPWTAPGEDANEASTWILISAFPFKTNEEVSLIMGYVIDISPQKWAQEVLTRNVAAATEAKRRQERFIDTTSHEMRNPLNAITQLADGIRHPASEPQSLEDYKSLVTENMDAANTILLCAAHQKRVIDDVLTLSRLESQLLSITAVPAEPGKVARDVVKMFDAELAAHDIKGHVIEPPADNLGAKIDLVLFDTSRIMQILINLLTNAIKFTASRSTREITISYGMQTSRQPPITTSLGQIHWVDTSDAQHDPRETSHGPQEAQEKLYLYFYVQDTGKGMSSTEMDKLFKRFSQTSARTHIDYGGTGLGLYICRQLAELQKGGVGVASKQEQGSVFGVFIEAEQPEPEIAAVLGANGTSSKIREPFLVELDVAPAAIEASNPSLRLDAKSSRRAPSRSPPMKKRRRDGERLNMLVVEDNLVNQRVLVRQLQAANCSVAVANHGKEALEVLQKSDCWDANTRSPGEAPVQIEIVLMDWEMPIMNGLECATRIRALQRSGDIIKPLRIIGTTANVRQEQIDVALAAGIDFVIAKPFTVSQLLDKIQ